MTKKTRRRIDAGLKAKIALQALLEQATVVDLDPGVASPTRKSGSDRPGSAAPWGIRERTATAAIGCARIYAFIYRWRYLTRHHKRCRQSSRDAIKTTGDLFGRPSLGEPVPHEQT
jgi:hypothetical protein